MPNSKQKMKTQKLPFSELHEIAVEEARRIHNAKVEHGIAIDECGNIIRVVGDFSTVEIKTDRPIIIALHNHPHEFKEPMSFSDIDILNLSENGLEEIMVCGYGYYFYLRKWDGMLRIRDVVTASRKICETAKKQAKHKNFTLYAPGSTTPKALYKAYVIDALRNYHEGLAEFTREKGLSYGKVKL